MRPLRRLLALSKERRRLLAKALFAVLSVRLGLWLLPFQTLRRLLTGRFQRDGRNDVAQRAANQIGWAVQVAGRYVPSATCLVQALAAQALLERSGHPASLHIGVAKNDEGRLEGHAWVESRGEIIVGGTEIGRYAPLLALRTEGS